MQPETPSLPEYFYIQRRERYRRSILRPILTLPGFFAALVEQYPEDVQEEMGEGGLVSAGKDELPYADGRSSVQKHEDKGYVLRPSTGMKGTTETSPVSATTGAVRTSTSGLLLPKFLLRNVTRNGASASPPEPIPNGSTGFPIRNRATQESKQRNEQEGSKVTRDVQLLKPPPYLSAPPGDSPLSEEKMVSPRSTLVNNQLGGSLRVTNTISTLSRLLQEQRVYQSPLTTQPLASSHHPLVSMTRSLAGKSQGTIGNKKAYMLPDEEAAQTIANEGSDFDDYNPREPAPVSISMNRPLLETLIVQNNTATNADEIRQRVEDVLLDIINSAVSKL